MTSVGTADAPGAETVSATNDESPSTVGISDASGPTEKADAAGAAGEANGIGADGGAGGGSAGGPDEIGVAERTIDTGRGTDRDSVDTVPVLYDYELSGNCYKIRLLAAMLGIAYRSETVEFYPAAAHRDDAFLAIDPMGALPVWLDGELVLRDSKAILVYLAARHDPDGSWYPSAGDPSRLARTVQWLAFGDALTASASAARLVEGFFHGGDLDTLRAEAHRLFRILDAHLWFGEREGRDWLVDGAAPTVADLACFPYVALSEEGGIDREDYPAIRRWLERVTRLPRFVTMPGVFAAGPAR